MSSTLHPMLNVAIRAARAAGAIINRAALDVEAVRISQKNINDFVTEVDHASEAAIIETLQLLRPIYRKTTNYGHFGKAGLPWEA